MLSKLSDISLPLKASLLKPLFVLLCLLHLSSAAQIHASAKKALTCSFDSSHVEYTEMAVISNVLKIKNNLNKNFSLQINISLPSGWRTLNNAQKKYKLDANDSLFIPVRLLTSNKKTKGGARYSIHAMVSIKETGQVISAGFFAGRPKISKMKMDVLPGSKVYFLNNESTSKFKVRFTNDGDEDQRILFSMTKIGKDFMVTDTNGHYFQKNYLELAVKPFSDSLLSFGVSFMKEIPNQKRIDTYSYLFRASEQKKQNTLFLKASEPRNTNRGTSGTSNTSDVVRMAKSIDFVKLNNSTKVNQNSYNTIPLSMQANFNNVINNQPVLNLILNGLSNVNEKSYVNYFYQNSFNYYLLGNQSNTKDYWQVGYFHNNGSLQAGTGVQLNMPQVRGIGNQGEGLAGTYNLTKDHRIGAFVSKNPNNWNLQGGNYGGGYSGKFKKIHFGAGYSHANMNKDYSADLLSVGTNFPLGKFQTLNLSGSLNRYLAGFKKMNGFTASLNYGISYLKKRANTSVRFLYNQYPNILTGNTASGKNKPIISAGLTNNFKITKQNGLNFEHYYSSNPVFNYNTKENLDNIFFNNYVNLISNKRQKVNYTPGFYVSYSEFFKQNLLSEGLQLSMNSSNLDQNFRLGLNLKGGFNKLTNYSYLGTFFTSQTSAFLSYRTWNLNLRYFYGPQGQSDIIYALTVQKKYSQNLYTAVSHQYQFHNKHFVLENNFSYNYLNINQRHTVGLFTQLFFYSTSGWRFSFNFNYNYTLAESFRYSYDPNVQNNYSVESNPSKQQAKSFQFGFGIKKDFSIPVPKRFTKAYYSSAPFKVFLDLNGNRVYDKDEAILENVVIQLNDYEVQTDSKGEATFENIALGKYKIKVFSLEELGAWFPVVEDSMDVNGIGTHFIPFSKGVQVLGNVEVDREKFSGAMNEKLDISRLKVFLADSTGKTLTTVTDIQGNFSFYVPFGKYVLKFDERMLGSSFELMENDIDLDLTSGIESYYHSFSVVEKRRKVKTKKFAPDGQVIETTEAAPATTELEQTAEPKKTENNRTQKNSGKNKKTK